MTINLPILCNCTTVAVLVTELHCNTEHFMCTDLALFITNNARLKGSGEFNKAASIAYHDLDSEARARLSSVAATDTIRELAPREIKKAGGRIFAKIKSMVCWVCFFKVE